ncbi:hypothetical protein CIG75_04500 [Tumebacillus algifaecis]|uniref:Integrase catalytic domain-containing protein n=1 Tax=Tumebacillus algifaecis TaxID=1214604 RepID=A0A223CYA8_9BACL|nr:hypothetical protein CIG75_04500 [Tumebacillus algifaecis]
MITSKQKEERQLKKLILQCHKAVRGTYGYYRVRAWLRRKHNLKINHKRVYRLMKELGIQCVARKKKRWFGKKSENYTAPNSLNRNFKASRPNEKWATDITYLLFNGQRLFLSVIYDMFNNEIVAYRIGERNDLKLVLDTVKLANKKRDVTDTLLHSDQGFQYTSHQYNKLLQTYNIAQSMSRKGNCLDNACVENFFGHLKSELMYLNKFRTKAEVMNAVASYIRFYNQQRIQRKLSDLSPVEYRTQVCA